MSESYLLRKVNIKIHKNVSYKTDNSVWTENQPMLLITDYKIGCLSTISNLMDS